MGQRENGHVRVQASSNDNASNDLKLATFAGQPIPNKTFLRGLEILIADLVKAKAVGRLKYLWISHHF